MSETQFAGQTELIARLDAAARQRTFEEITGGVQTALEDLIRDDAIRLPDSLKATSKDSYARRLVYRSELYGYTVIAMVWGPGQGALLHDHSGIWCVEGVLEGVIAVTPYEALEHDHERWRFEANETVMSGVGSAGSLIPPFEYHTISNPQDDEIAITLHVYGTEMRSCHVFEPAEDGWYDQHLRKLSYTA
ncbi:MAG: cysteine dioxygenase family protein [Acidobacteriota bacterium]